jgi:hypothetical protein
MSSAGMNRHGRASRVATEAATDPPCRFSATAIHHAADLNPTARKRSAGDLVRPK